MIDDTNCTPNFKRHLAHNLRQDVSSMSEVDKAQCLASIQAHVTLLNLPHDPKILQYVTTLLKDKRPRNGIS